MSWEVEGSDVGFKSILILSEMVYVKAVREDCFSLVSESFSIRENQEMEGERMRRSEKEGDSSSLAAVSLGYLQPRAEEEMTIYWVSHKGD